MSFSFGRRNPHCSNCGNERGGPFGHEISECLYRSGMTVIELAGTMPPERKSRYLDAAIDEYFKRADRDDLQETYPGSGIYE